MSSPAIVRDINHKLILARKAYYSGETLLMTDAEYDSLEAQLAALIVQHPELASSATVLTSVGTTAPTGARIKHVRPMLSIENQYEKDGVVKWFADLQSKAD